MPHQLTSPRTADPDAPVVVRFAALGDVVLLTVLLQALAQRWGRPVHVLSSGPWTPVLLGQDPSVSELRLVSSRRSPHWLTPSRWAADAWLRAHRGPVYHCELDRWAERIVQRAGIAEHRMVRAWSHAPQGWCHWADWWLDIAGRDPAGIQGPALAAAAPARPRLHLSPAWRDDCDAWLRQRGLQGRPLILLQPGNKKTFKRGRIATAGHDKHWPATHWGAVVRGLWASMPGSAVLVCGSERESGLAREILDTAGAPPAGHVAVNLAADQPALSMLCALTERAAGMVSVDTGPAHVAGAMDCPLVVMYASAGWGRWRPRAATAEVRVLGPEAPTEGARLEQITPDEVLAEWTALRKRFS
ncbi:MAG: glycosyltransferase family 9 protein [Aquabacterium sp.]